MGDHSSSRYVVISADCHAGAAIEQYRPYLEKEWHDEFDDWARKFADPWSDLEQADFKLGVKSADSTLNWESDQRVKVLESEGIVAEVVFPNTAPPFFPSGVFCVNPPQSRTEYERRAAGFRAHNRWLVDFCADAPGRRAGVAQVFLYDIDETLEQIRWIKEAGLTGGILLPGDAQGGLTSLYYPRLDPVWQLCEELEVPVHRHSNVPAEANTPETGPGAPAVGMIEGYFFAHRALAHLIFAGVFERFPKLTFVMTEVGSAWIPKHLAELDYVYEASKVKGSIVASFAGAASALLPKTPSEYFASNCYIGASFMSQAEGAMREEIGVDKLMWGSDLPHSEGTYPFSQLAMRAAFAETPEDQVRMMLGANAAKVYGFDMAALQQHADRVGPTVDQIREPVLEMPRTPEETVSPALVSFAVPGRD